MVVVGGGGGCLSLLIPKAWPGDQAWSKPLKLWRCNWRLGEASEVASRWIGLRRCDEWSVLN